MDLLFLYLFSAGVFAHLESGTVQGPFTMAEVLEDNRVLTTQSLIQGLYHELLIYAERSPSKYSVLHVGNLNGSSVDSRNQMNHKKLIRKSGSSRYSSKSPEKPVDPMRPRKPGTRGQGWDPGGQRPPEHPFPHNEPYSAYSGIRPWSDSQPRTSHSKYLLFTISTRPYIYTYCILFGFFLFTIGFSYKFIYYEMYNINHLVCFLFFLLKAFKESSFLTSFSYMLNFWLTSTSISLSHLIAPLVPFHFYIKCSINSTPFLP